MLIGFERERGMQCQLTIAVPTHSKNKNRGKGAAGPRGTCATWGPQRCPAGELEEEGEGEGSGGPAIRHSGVLWKGRSVGGTAGAFTMTPA